jgi:cytochrome c biogenesis protein CcmG/thiol:disulfide interchange protein DsbE
MATSKSRPTATHPRPPGKPPAAGRRPPWLWAGLGVVVLLLAIVAVVASRGSNDGTDAAAEGLEQTRPVEVSGSPLPEFSARGADPAVGRPAPELRGQSFDGTPVEVTHGRPKLLVFVAHWCRHCQREVPVIVEHLRSQPLPDSIDLVAISTGVSPDQPNYPPSTWLRRERWTAPVLADSSEGAAADAFGLASFPYFVAVDGAGKVVARTSGELGPDQFDQLAARALGR